MTWLSWRQQRAETLIAAGMLAALAALLVPTGLHMASLYHHDGIAACVGKRTGVCRQAVDSFSQQITHLDAVFGWFNLVPGLVGVLLAAPLLLDLEGGTYQLAWTQSVTRRRWLATKLGLAVGTALLAALALVLLTTWWRTPRDSLYGRMQPSVFDFEGTVGFGYVLFALGLALSLGVVLRRAVPALVVGFAVYVGSRVFVDSWLRQRLLPPLSAIWPITKPGPNLDRAWVLSAAPSDRLGHSAAATLGALQSCATAVGQGAKRVDPACLARHGAGFNHVLYEPASRFWPLQGIETALFGGAALLLIAFAAWWLHERTA